MLMRKDVDNRRRDGSVTWRTTSSPDYSNTAKPRRVSRKHLWLIGVALIGLLAAGHASVLSAIGGILVVDQPWTACDVILILGGNGCFDEAARLYREDASRQVLLIEACPSRVVEAGILPSFETLARHELTDRGVESASIRVLRGGARTPEEAATLLQDLLSAQGGTHVLALCDRFRSRRQRRIFDKCLDVDTASRVAVSGLPDRRFDERSWWKNRRGVKEFLVASLALAHTWFQKEAPTPPEPWDADRYERQLQLQAAGVTG